MYAIIEVGGKQYQVKENDVLEVEKQDAKEGQTITLNNVLLLSNGKDIEAGRPFLKQAKVTAEVLDQLKAKKKVAYKFRRRKSSHWKKGHRQRLTRLKIKEIIIS